MGKRKKKDPLSYRHRDYRRSMAADGLAAFRVTVSQSDLYILASRPAQSQALDLLMELRAGLEAHIAASPAFASSLVPVEDDPLAPPLVREMSAAAAAAGVGPMAAVAGAIAERVGRGLLALEGVDEVVVENGGDVFIQRASDAVAALFAGGSPLSGRVGIRIAAAAMPAGVCTSSASIGHSLSFGEADAACVVAESAALADAAATRIANETRGPDGIEAALETAAAIPGLRGAVVIVHDRLGAWGEVELVDVA